MSSNNATGVTPAPKPSSTAANKPSRLPAPTLFVGPPSRTHSQLSVHRVLADAAAASNKPAREHLAHQRSTLSRGAGGDDDASPRSADPGKMPVAVKPLPATIDARWREMQSTLDEVELTAQSTTHVFGASHAAALDDLRNAQIALAKAWGRGSEEGKAEEEREEAAAAAAAVGGSKMDRFKAADDIASDRSKAAGQRPRAATGTSMSTTLSDESELTETDARSGTTQPSRMEDETAQDIKRATERRSANEAYFKKVDLSVKEVVEKLEKVAEAMRGVESESRSLWSQSDATSSGVAEQGGGRASSADGG